MSNYNYTLIVARHVRNSPGWLQSCALEQGDRLGVTSQKDKASPATGTKEKEWVPNTMRVFIATDDKCATPCPELPA